MTPMTPWVRGFTGEVVVLPTATSPQGESPQGARKSSTSTSAGGVKMGDAPTTFASRGVATLTAEGIEVSELPVGTWTADYKGWLLKQMDQGTACWDDVIERHTEATVRFLLTAKKTSQLAQLAQLGASSPSEMRSRLRLESSHSLSNAHAFDADGELRHFVSPHEIIELHAAARLDAYERRKAHQLSHLAADLGLLEARAR